MTETQEDKNVANIRNPLTLLERRPYQGVGNVLRWISEIPEKVSTLKREDGQRYFPDNMALFALPPESSEKSNTL